MLILTVGHSIIEGGKMVFLYKQKREVSVAEALKILRDQKKFHKGGIVWRQYQSDKTMNLIFSVNYDSPRDSAIMELSCPNGREKTTNTRPGEFSPATRFGQVIGRVPKNFGEFVP